MNEEIRQRTKWFMEDRFGMFIHWGLYSIPACGEWMMSQKEMTIEEYSKYFDQFDPVDYDPKKWVCLAKKAGMKYVVLTAKHHDGFCLFDSKLTDYKSTNTKAGRDLVREFVDACREEGLKVGLYFPLSTGIIRIFLNMETGSILCETIRHIKMKKLILTDILRICMAR